MPLTDKQIEELRELYEQMPGTLSEWESRYKIDFCPGTHYDFGNGLHAATGESSCLYPERKGQMCDGHENQNWSRLRGLETYRDEKTDVEYVESRTAQFIVAICVAMPALLATLAEKDAENEVLRTRLASLLFSGKFDNITSDTIRAWADEYPTKLTAELQHATERIAEAVGLVRKQDAVGLEAWAATTESNRND